MKIVKTITELRLELNELRKNGEQMGLVPTMGALHEGHISLMNKARLISPNIVASIFVNPTQFGPNEDFSNYPRTLESDLEKCRQAGLALVFCPVTSEVYENDTFISFKLNTLGEHLCGSKRPGHFNGVIQIVNKLFNLFKPDFAVFGQKDIQQFRIIEQMNKEFNHDVDLVRGETMRAADGLALSSRNRYLNTDERKLAPALYHTLKSIQSEIMNNTPIDTALQKYTSELDKSGLKTDYLSVVSYRELQPITAILKGEPFIIAGAVYLGKTRLIDNIVVE